MAEMSTLSLEFVKVQVTFRENGVLQDPTADTVEMAFVQPGSSPGAPDWKPATWETAVGPRYLARTLVGPGGTVTLTADTYRVWVRVTDNPEIPVKPAPGFLKVF